MQTHDLVASTVTRTGVTAEGRPCVVRLHFASDACQDSPERVTGRYESADGGGEFEIVREGALYRLIENGATHARPHDLLPWAVAEGEW